MLESILLVSVNYHSPTIKDKSGKQKTEKFTHAYMLNTNAKLDIKSEAQQLTYIIGSESFNCGCEIYQTKKI